MDTVREEVSCSDHYHLHKFINLHTHTYTHTPVCLLSFVVVVVVTLRQDFTLWPWLYLNVWQPSCFCLLTARITDMHH